MTVTSYATLPQLRESKHFKTGATGDDALLIRLLKAATRWIESPAGAQRVFAVELEDDEPVPDTRYFDASAVTKRRLWLDQDLCRLDSIANGDNSSIPLGAVRTEPRNETPYYAIDLLPTAGASYRWLFDNDGEIAITGLWAFSITPPDEIVQATIRLAGWMYDQWRTGSEGSGDRAVVAGDGFMFLPSRVPRDVADVVWSYRRSPL